MIREFFERGGTLAQGLPGYESRPEQIEMAEAVLDALERDRPVVVEAGTGTGKTLAYLVAAIASGRKVLISTGTKTLQEQIFGKDLPLLERLLPGTFSAAYMKGISNYLCLRRFREADVQSATLLEWARRTRTGDRAELSDLPDDAPIWRDIQSTPETRIGPRCRFFEDCFVTQMRRAAAQATVVVVNHHLFFADLALRSEWPQAQVVPPHEAVIFDEAHGLEEIATEYFGVQVSSHRLAALVRDSKRLAPEDAHLPGRIEALAQALFGHVAARLGIDSSAMVSPEFWQGPALADYHALDNALDEASARYSRSAQDEVTALATRISVIRDDLAMLVERKHATHVYWAETRGRGTFLHASPIEVAPLLREQLVARQPALVFTSATLSVDGSFDYFLSRIGLDQAPERRTLSLASPFDYATQSILYVPRDLPEPQEADFVERASQRMQALLEVTRGRALLLFTSYRNLRATEQRLRRAQLPYPLLVQGEQPRTYLLDKLRSEIGSVLLATASFWEGVDIAGEALQLVVIDKLPFSPPDDPISSARARQLREQGRQPFREYQLPRAALALKQGFGRLIRHRQDRGIVAVLDGRLLAKPYGKVLLRSLPAGAPLTSSLEEVKTWWARS